MRRVPASAPRAGARQAGAKVWYSTGRAARRQGNAGAWRPCHQAERRASTGTPASGRPRGFRRWRYAVARSSGPRVPAPTGRTGQRSAFPGRPRGFRRWRCAVARSSGPRVPAPTGRTGRRSAFPGLHVAPHSGVEPKTTLGRARQKNNGGEPPVRRPPDRGESVKGGTPPFTIKNDQSELAEVRLRRTREFRFPSQERLGVGFPDPSPSRSGVSVRLSPHFGNRREAPGGSRKGPPRPDPT